LGVGYYCLTEDLNKDYLVCQIFSGGFLTLGEKHIGGNQDLFGLIFDFYFNVSFVFFLASFFGGER